MTSGRVCSRRPWCVRRDANSRLTQNLNLPHVELGEAAVVADTSADAGWRPLQDGVRRPRSRSPSSSGRTLGPPAPNAALQWMRNWACFLSLSAELEQPAPQ